MIANGIEFFTMLFNCLYSLNSIIRKHLNEHNVNTRFLMVLYLNMRPSFFIAQDNNNLFINKFFYFIINNYTRLNNLTPHKTQPRCYEIINTTHSNEHDKYNGK